MKYKLIKLYPGSPVLGTIAKRGAGIEYTYPDGRVIGHCSSKGDEFKELIENHPEYWELVDESIFTTNDGVKINVGDQYFYIAVNGTKVLKCTHAQRSFTPHISFSEYSAGANYLLNNSAVLTLKEVKDSYRRNPDIFLASLQDTVRRRIDLVI